MNLCNKRYTEFIKIKDTKTCVEILKYEQNIGIKYVNGILDVNSLYK